jgi:hypothetical protein
MLAKAYSTPAIAAWLAADGAEASTRVRADRFARVQGPRAILGHGRDFAPSVPAATPARRRDIRPRRRGAGGGQGGQGGQKNEFAHGSSPSNMRRASL